MSRNSNFTLSCTVDFPDDIIYGPYSEPLLDKMMQKMVSMGVKRIFWNFYENEIFDRSVFRYGYQTLSLIGEPVKAAVPVAHKHGLEIYAGIKPFNAGTSGSFPEGSPDARDRTLSCIGGKIAHAMPFVENHPEKRIRRRECDISPDHPVEKIRLIKRDDAPTRLRKENLEIWTSQNNHLYERRPIEFSLEENVQPAPREIIDYFGALVTSKGAPVQVLTLKGLNLTDRYILITTNFKDDAGDFQNTAVGMIEAYGPGDERLSIVVATRRAALCRTRDFRTYGLEFDSGLGPVQFSLDVYNAPGGGEGGYLIAEQGGVIAFARGKNQYLPCAPCEAYPEVRDYWMGQVRQMLDAGVDGIDIRTSAHGSNSDEPHEFGFNEPIVDEYRRRFGNDPTTDQEDLKKIAELRGEHYTAFLKEASQAVRENGKKMHVHLHAEAFRPDPCYGQLMAFPANLHFDWKRWLREGLIDSATLRTSWWEAVEDASDKEPSRSRLENALEDPVVKEMLSVSNEVNVPVTINRYVHRAVGTEEYVSDLETIFNDNRFSGFDLYEFKNLARPTPDGSRLIHYEDRIDRIIPKVTELGLL